MISLRCFQVRCCLQGAHDLASGHLALALRQNQIHYPSTQPLNPQMVATPSFHLLRGNCLTGSPSTSPSTSSHRRSKSAIVSSPMLAQFHLAIIELAHWFHSVIVTISSSQIPSGLNRVAIENILRDHRRERTPDSQSSQRSQTRTPAEPEQFPSDRLANKPL
jgi:hypothetical protein